VPESDSYFKSILLETTNFVWAITKN